jgi:hypothetical protein
MGNFFETIPREIEFGICGKRAEPELVRETDFIDKSEFGFGEMWFP